MAEYEDYVLLSVASTVKDLEDNVAAKVDRRVGIQCFVIFLLKTFHTGLVSVKDPKHS